MSDNILHVICAELAEVKRTLASLHADVQAGSHARRRSVAAFKRSIAPQPHAVRQTRRDTCRP